MYHCYMPDGLSNNRDSKRNESKEPLVERLRDTYQEVAFEQHSVESCA